MHLKKNDADAHRLPDSICLQARFGGRKFLKQLFIKGLPELERMLDTFFAVISPRSGRRAI
jgi:hypothetical protein